MAKAKRDSLAAEARRQSMAAARDEKRKLKGVEVEMSAGMRIPVHAGHRFRRMPVHRSG